MVNRENKMIKNRKMLDQFTLLVCGENITSKIYAEPLQIDTSYRLLFIAHITLFLRKASYQINPKSFSQRYKEGPGRKTPYS